MAIVFRKQNNEEDGGNIFWVTMADLMLGLAIIFITLFVLAMTGFSQQDIQQQQSSDGSCGKNQSRKCKMPELMPMLIK